MSLTQPTAYNYGTKTSAVEEMWYIKLYYDTETSFLGLSDKELDISSVHYYGNVIDWGEIVETIDLANSKASSSDAEIICSNKFKNTSLMKELYGGTRKYLNRKIEIFSYVNNSSMQIYTGKLINIHFDGSTLTLSIVSWRPWDKITIPQDIETTHHIYAPIAYGDFESNSDFCTGVSLYPAPVSEFVGQHIFAILANTVSSGLQFHYYDTNLNKFYPVTDSDTATSTLHSVDQASIPYKVKRTVKWRPSREASGNEFDNPDYAYDDDPTGTAASKNSLFTLNFNFKCKALEPDLGKAISNISINGSFSVTLTSFTNSSCSVLLRDYMYDTDRGIIVRRLGTDGTGTTSDTSFSSSLWTDYSAANYQLPEALRIQLEINAAGGSINATGRIYDIYYYGTYEVDLGSDTDYMQTITNLKQKIKYLYVNTDGMTKSYSGGSGIAELPHEIFRDLLARFTDFDYADSSLDGWSDLNTARSGWTCRWWLLEPRSLISILDQIQYEGCFIFKMKNDGSGGKFIRVKDSYSSSDVVHTLSESDYNYMLMGLTDFDELVTWTKYNYVRHPAKSNTYLSNPEYKNTTARSNWFASVTNENYEERNLDFITADKVYNSGSHTNPNDCVALYYDNIVANPRILIEINLTNAEKLNLEVGDIIKFNDSNNDPYNKDWADLYFMIVETRRTKGQMIINAREVYEA